MINVVASLTLVCGVGVVVVLVVLTAYIYRFFLLGFLGGGRGGAGGRQDGVFIHFSCCCGLYHSFSTTGSVELCNFASCFVLTITGVVCRLRTIGRGFTHRGVGINNAETLLGLLHRLITCICLACLIYDDELSISSFVFCFNVVANFSG